MKDSPLKIILSNKGGGVVEGTKFVVTKLLRKNDQFLPTFLRISTKNFPIFQDFITIFQDLCDSYDQKILK